MKNPSISILMFPLVKFSLEKGVEMCKNGKLKNSSIFYFVNYDYSVIKCLFTRNGRKQRVFPPCLFCHIYRVVLRVIASVNLTIHCCCIGKTIKRERRIFQLIVSAHFTFSFFFFLRFFLFFPLITPCFLSFFFFLIALLRFESLLLSRNKRAKRIEDFFFFFFAYTSLHTARRYTFVFHVFMFILCF